MSLWISTSALHFDRAFGCRGLFLRCKPSAAKERGTARQAEDTGDHGVYQSGPGAVQRASGGCAEDVEARADDLGIARVPGTDDPDRYTAVSGVHERIDDATSRGVLQGIRRAGGEGKIRRVDWTGDAESGRQRSASGPACGDLEQYKIVEREPRRCGRG